MNKKRELIASRIEMEAWNVFADCYISWVTPAHRGEPVNNSPWLSAAERRQETREQIAMYVEDCNDLCLIADRVRNGDDWEEIMEDGMCLDTCVRDSLPNSFWAARAPVTYAEKANQKYKLEHRCAGGIGSIKRFASLRK